MRAAFLSFGVIVLAVHSGGCSDSVGGDAVPDSNAPDAIVDTVSDAASDLTEADGAKDDATSTDALGEGKADAPALTVSIVSPSDKTYTHGAVVLEAMVTGGVPDGVSFFDGTTSIGSVGTSPFKCTWDTTLRTEGTATVTARATSGSGTFVSPPITITIDRTSPGLASITPTASAAVSVWANIGATFDEALLASSVTDGTVTLRDETGTAIAKTLTLSPDGKRLTVVPTAKAVAPSGRTLSLSAAITDLAGNSLGFESWGWTYPAYLCTDPLGTPAGISLAVDATDAPWVAYVEVTTSSIQAAKWEGGAWTAIGSSVSSAASEPTLLIPPGGKPLVAFSKSSDAYVRRWNGTAWEAVGGAINPVSGSKEAGNPALAADSTGRILVAFTQRSPTSPYPISVYVYRWDGSAWSALGGELSAYAGDTWALVPRLAVDASDVPYVAWDEDSTDGGVWDGQPIVRRWDGSAWVGVGSTIGTVGSVTKYTGMLGLASAGGSPFALWVEGSTAPNKLYVARYAGSGPWSLVGGAAVPCSTECTYADFGAMVLDSKAHPMIAWLTPAPAIDVWQFDGATWKSFVGPYTAAPGVVALGAPAIALDSTDRPWVAWAEKTTSYTLRLAGPNR